VDIPVWVVVALVNLLLLGAGLILFLPESPLPLGRKEAQRLVDKYGKFLIAAGAVLLAHLLLVQADAAITARLPYHDLAPAVDGLERGVVPSLQHLWNAPLNYFFSIVYVAVHPWMLFFPILLYVLSDEERPAKAHLLMFPLAFAMALPFYILLPLTNVYVYHHVQSPVFELFPQLTDIYYSFTTVNNTFPSLQVAFAALTANAARYSRNRNFRVFAYAYAVCLVLATLYLNIHWIVDVLGGLLVAALVAVFTSRFISTERLALQRVKPTPEEAQGTVERAERLLERMRAEIAARGMPGKPMLVGSVAKDTYLRSNVDLDAFVLFPMDTPREKLEAWGLELGRAVLDDPEEKYAEHPYTHGLFEGVKADAVPAYEIADVSQRMTAVDRTPFHTRFVLARMSREQRDQTRLLKAFMKGVGVYGAEAKTHGFSGYLCELLVLKYGSFRKVLQAGQAWKPGTFLVLDRLEGTPRFNDPLIFLDPVDTRRNAASAVSSDTLAHFSESCRAYLRREGLQFFFPRQLVPRPPDELELAVRRRRSDFILVRTRAPDVLEDHLHDQMRKATDSIRRLLERHEFDLKRATHEVGGRELLILLELPRIRLPDTVTHTGPPVKSKEHADRFRKSWASHRDARSPVYEEEGRLKVERLREFRRADDLLRAKLLEYDCGKHLNEVLREGFEVEAGLDVVDEATAKLLTRHLNRKKSWEF
jgi:tRNA nucleotidyltransferase (CCA-adding enzyme)